MIGSQPTRRERARAVLHRAHLDPRDLVALARTRPGRWYYRLALSWALWPLVGSLAALWRRTALRRSTVIAVVGSYGKTTTRFAAAAALGLGAARDSENSWSYVARDLLRGRPGRPVIIEIGISRRGQMASYARVLRPDVVLATAIGSSHWTSIGGIDQISHEKGVMVAALRPGGLAVLNGDDERILAMASLTGARVLTCGIGAANDLRAENVSPTASGGVSFDAVDGSERIRVATPLRGEPGVRATLMSIALAKSLDLPLPEALDRLRDFAPPPARMQWLPLPSGATLLVDGANGSEESYEVAFTTLRRSPARRRIAVVGDIGEPHPPQSVRYFELGTRAAACSDRLLVVGRRLKKIRQGAVRAGLERSAVTGHRNVVDAAAALRGEMRPGDLVLLSGRTDQRVERIAYALAGRAVRCAIRHCSAHGVACSTCPMLLRGWDGLRPVT